MFSPTSSPNMLLDDIYKTSLEAIDRNTIDDYNVYGIDFMDPLTDWQVDSFESVAADYLSSCFSPPSFNDLASSDHLLHIQTGLDSIAHPSVQLEKTVILVSNEDQIESNSKGLGFSFDKKRKSAFLEWKANEPKLRRSCKPPKKSSLQKRCIRFLNDINNHRIPRPLSFTNNSAYRSMAFSNSYDKLAIHHVVAERKRREQMSELFSDLRALVPVKPKNAGRATVLLQTKDYVIHLKNSVQQLEQRNRELEALLYPKS